MGGVISGYGGERAYPVNTRTAEAVLGDCDADVFVVSADPPITEVELGYLK